MLTLNVYLVQLSYSSLCNLIVVCAVVCVSFNNYYYYSFFSFVSIELKHFLRVGATDGGCREIGRTKVV